MIILGDRRNIGVVAANLSPPCFGSGFGIPALIVTWRGRLIEKWEILFAQIQHIKFKVLTLRGACGNPVRLCTAYDQSNLQY
jgi:hypothetical protein